MVAVVEQNHRKMERAVRNGGCEPGKEDWVEAIASAARKNRLLYELTGELGSSLSLHETLVEFDSRLRKLADYHAMAVWTPRENHLAAAYVSGKEARWLCSLEIPYGQGLSGRVAETRQAVRNGDPREEGPCPADGAGAIALRSAMVAPLEHHAELAGVLALYHGEAAAFREDDLGVLLSIRKKLAAAVANALKYESAERLSTVDPATALPNERALFLRLDAELARCRRNGGTLAVLACEVDGIERVARRPGLLQSAAAGLRRLCREEDCVARMGDRFVLVLCNFARRHLADKQKRIEALLAELSPAAGGGRPLTAKVGAAFSPEDGGCAEDLLALADSRINLARRGGEAEAVLDEARS
jgi:diguanylate cyclase (GGDEF)-like protein